MEGVTRKFTAKYALGRFTATFDAMDYDDAKRKMVRLVSCMLNLNDIQMADEDIEKGITIKYNEYDKAILIGDQRITLKDGLMDYIPRMSVVNLKRGIQTCLGDGLVSDKAHILLSVDQMCASRKVILLCSETNELFVVKNLDGMEMNRIKGGDTWWRITTIEK